MTGKMSYYDLEMRGGKDHKTAAFDILLLPGVTLCDTYVSKMGFLKPHLWEIILRIKLENKPGYPPTTVANMRTHLAPGMKLRLAERVIAAVGHMIPITDA
ncbi:hypothetical protein [Hymenobacter siberiensis]|uniref:hypothetical protein n=1 Tax=Hymenobacter siberiensis TaxID=2848396 RepID=UPI001C1E1F8E|nr:hypothetical protein [Hymenobacter siberiensis]